MHVSMHKNYLNCQPPTTEVTGLQPWLTSLSGNYVIYHVETLDTNGGAYVKDILGNYIIIPDKSYKQVSFKYLKFLNHNNTWQFISRLKSQEFLPVS